MTHATEIKSLEGLSFDGIYATHLLAFKDYPFQWSRVALYSTIRRRGFTQSLSFGAFHDTRLVSFTLNGIGSYGGLRSAYDTGTGTIAEYRGLGLASRIFEHAAPVLKSLGIRQYVLEVLEENKKAYSVYAKQGFKTSRRFDCFRVDSDEWRLPGRKEPGDVHLRPIDCIWREQMEPMLDFSLSWQNNFAALMKEPAHFKVIGAFSGEEFVGYGIIEPDAGDIPQLAVKPGYRRRGIGSMLLHELKKLNRAGIVKVVNIPSDQEIIREFILRNGIPKIVCQFEMIKML